MVQLLTLVKSDAKEPSLPPSGIYHCTLAHASMRCALCPYWHEVMQLGEKAAVIFTWGRGREGQLGNGLRSDSAAPVCVAELQGRQVLQASNKVLLRHKPVMPGPSPVYV